MRRSVILTGILLLCGTVNLPARAKQQSKSDSYESGIVLTVDKYVPESNYLGTPTDAPLQSEYYGYDVGIRVNCTMYVGRYESALDYVPVSLAPDHPVQVLVHKHTLHVRMPELGREVELQMVGHKHVKGNSCRVHG